MKKGILLPIFSLPSKYGIGDFGYEAYEFIDILSSSRINYWQILPINSCFDSPYSPRSFYALNENFISLDKLKEQGLITSTISLDNSLERIDYNILDKTKYYIEAFNNFNPDKDYYDFINSNDELINYAVFMSNNHINNEDYYLFLQYILFQQWNELLNYAHKKNVYIIGDMPIYPDYFSSEVFFNADLYQLDINNKPKYVSGAPGDYFNINGQKWGHPLYNFNKMKLDNFKYLIERYLYFNKLFDITRIDHFKAFEKYYNIPFDGEPKDGFYKDGPSYDFFNELFKYTKPERFIVEDLGDITESTLKLRDTYNFKGMKIIQYTLDTSNKIDTCKSGNMIVYTGNHDNNTIVGWYNTLEGYQKNNVNNFLDMNKIPDDIINNRLIKYLLKTSFDNDIVIIPVQDILGLDENGRINLPGVVDNSNWSWRLKDFKDFKKRISIMNE